MMHEISRRGPCSDGRLPVLTGINASGELYTYDLQCGDVRSEEQRIGRRDTETLCTTSCTQVCYHPVGSWFDSKGHAILISSTG